MGRGSARPGTTRAGSEPTRGISRRSLLAILPAASVARALSQRATAPQGRGTGLRVVVVGAGAFGGWTALSLVRRGV